MILLIDDDLELCELLAEYLGAEGLSLEAAHDGTSGLERAASGEHRLVILDVMLPGQNGFEVLRKLRSTSSVPVLMLTARGRDVDRIVGLEMGADDYLSKPFNPRELVARIRAIMRRADHDSFPGLQSDRLVVGNLSLHAASRTAMLDSAELELTSIEFTLLEVLLKGAGEVVSREQISELVLERRFSPLDRSIDVHVSNLRKKLGPGRIKTVRGHGYLLVRESPRNRAR